MDYLAPTMILGGFVWSAMPIVGGLWTKLRQSGESPANHGRMSKAGQAHAPGMVVEAAETASRAPGPLRAFYRCVKNRRGFPVAVAATACKMTVLCWLGDVVDQLVDDRSFGDGLEGGEAGQRVEER